VTQLNGEQIAANVRELAEKWAAYDGGERAEAQTFLNELFAAYGTDRREAGARFEDPQPMSGGIMDCRWPPHVIFEMKRPSETSRLAYHREQALRYWRHSADVETGEAATRFVVLCSFQRLEIWEPGRFPNDPRKVVDLSGLADSYEVLLFLARDEPLFLQARRDLTTEAAAEVSKLYEGLLDRSAAPEPELRRFILQLVWCFFAEDLRLLDGQPVSRILSALRKEPERSSAAELGHLFTLLDDDSGRTNGGIYQGTPYANGGLFTEAARVHLEPEEVEMAAQASRFDWDKVDPTIFGSLMEGVLGRNRRWELGAHYTHEADILRIVRPTIIDPWQARIDAVDGYEAAEALAHELALFRVLDPACGCGNFLYIAFRELRRLTRDLHARADDLRRLAGIAERDEPLPVIDLGNLHGIEIDAFTATIARVTLWMGHKLVLDEYGTGPGERYLPLHDLDTIRNDDALFPAQPWPEVDAIVGNPPFQGSQHLRALLGDQYLQDLKAEFQAGIKDLCVYWFRKANDHLKPGQRAGLVATNSVSQNRARGASLDYVKQGGGVITDAVSSEPWPGDAKVHVSLVNWIKEPAEPPTSFRLDGVAVDGITTSLTPGSQRALAPPLDANRGRSFQGPIPVGAGFLLSDQEAADLIADPSVDYRPVVRRYLVNDDLVDRPLQDPSRWIIDFGTRSLDEAASWPRALDVVRQRVKPDRDRNRDRGFREQWWRFGRPRAHMRAAIAGLARYPTGTATGKRALFSWTDPQWCPSNLVYVFAFEDDHTFGVLSSTVHEMWARSQSSTLEDRLRYTNTTAFEPFPFPDPAAEQRERIGSLARQVVELRRKHCVEHGIGLTALYNAVDDGAFTDLAEAHRALDRAVAEAYGWPAGTELDRREVVDRLWQLNADITAGTIPYDPHPPLPAAPADDGPVSLPF